MPFMRYFDSFCLRRALHLYIHPASDVTEYETPNAGKRKIIS